MTALQAWLEKYFDARSLRERVLIACTLFAATWGLWLMFIGGGLMDERDAAGLAIKRLDQEVRQHQTQISALHDARNAPHKQMLRVRQQDLQDRIAALRGDVDELLAGFVAPEHVPMLLEDILSQHQGLTLIRLSSQPAEPLQLSDPDKPSTPADDSPESVLEIYRHPVQMVFEGGYMDVLAYLEAIEKGQWRFAWRRLEYEVTAYPKAQVFIEVETLSREKEWLGV